MKTFHELTLAKGKCAETVLHLMKDERSKKAVQAAIDFGEGKITEKELAAAAAYAAAAADDDARSNNRKETADICRKIIGKTIIEKVNKIL